MLSVAFDRVLCLFVIVFCSIQGGCYNAAYKHLNKGVELHKEGDLETAIEEYTKAIGIDPEYALPYFNRASVMAFL